LKQFQKLWFLSGTDFAGQKRRIPYFYWAMGDSQQPLLNEGYLTK
jgi:hypothetical protein